MAQDGGVLVRAGHTEACCDLARLAGLAPAAVICEIMHDDGTMARLPDLLQFAAEHKLKIGTIADLIEYRSRNESLVKRGARARHRRRRGATSTWCRTATWRSVPSTSRWCWARSTPKNETLVRVHEPLSVHRPARRGQRARTRGASATRCRRSARRAAA